MTYDAFEISVEQSQPVETYRFTLGADSFYYTSAEDIVQVSLINYIPEAISRTNLQQTSEERDTTLEITVPGSNIFAGKYVAVVPGSQATVSIQRLQRLDGATPQVVTIFTGRVRSVSFVENGTVAKIAAVPLAAATSRPIPRFMYHSICNHVLYDVRCGVLETSFDFAGTVSVSSGNTITVPGVAGFAADFFKAGRVDIDGGSDSRLILSHSGNVVTMLLPFPRDITGVSVTLFAGCDHSLPTCKTKFNNVLRYGGYAWVPKKNPYATGLD